MERVINRIPQMDCAIAVHLGTQGAASWGNEPKLQSRACRISSFLMSKAYTTTGQAAHALHAMAILQVHQAKALKDLEEGYICRNCAL